MSLFLGGSTSCWHLLSLLRKLEHIVLVDDERANFRNDSSSSDAKIFRYCKA